jgi:hypothetical protein
MPFDMDSADALNQILDKHANAGLSALTADEQALCRINVFLIDCDNGGLSGFLYNSCHDDAGPLWRPLEETVKALRALGQKDIAAALQRALELVTGVPMLSEETWGEFLARADVSDELEALDSEISDAAEDAWEKLYKAAAGLPATTPASTK